MSPTKGIAKYFSDRSINRFTDPQSIVRYHSIAISKKKLRENLFPFQLRTRHPSMRCLITIPIPYFDYKLYLRDIYQCVCSRFFPPPTIRLQPNLVFASIIPREILVPLSSRPLQVKGHRWHQCCKSVIFSQNSPNVGTRVTFRMLPGSRSPVLAGIQSWSIVLLDCSWACT